MGRVRALKLLDERVVVKVFIEIQRSLGKRGTYRGIWNEKLSELSIPFKHDLSYRAVKQMAWINRVVILISIV